MRIISAFALSLLLTGAAACSGKTGHKTTDATTTPQYVTVKDGNFVIGDSIYKFIGTNFWYGAILGSEGRGGDRDRLSEELDLMQQLGIDNIRVLAGGDGYENVPFHIMPVLQSAPGTYNDTILDGLDYLMAQLEKRDMKAVLYLNNAWEWSGGFGQYLEWAGRGKAPDPTLDGYNEYVDYVSHFVTDDSAKALAADHVRHMVTRTNRYTGKPYAMSPAIMSWQIANEPRPFASDSVTRRAFVSWIRDQAALIRSLDPNHMISTGSEGLIGCDGDIGLWNEIHTDPNIDYGIIHLWPYNWRWVDLETLSDTVPLYDLSDEYIARHAQLMHDAGRPLVLEEFGFPRDGRQFAPGTPTTARDAFFSHILSLIRDTDMIQGCNIWGWGGIVTPAHEYWQPWDPYTGDPAQEPQGLYSVFADDSTTIRIIRTFTTAIHQK